MGDRYLRTRVRCPTIPAVMGALVAISGLLLACAVLPPSARADAQIPLGGGSGIVVEGNTLCTLTAIGNDNRGNLIGFTSAHCGGPGERGAAGGAEGAGGIGTRGAG